MALIIYNNILKCHLKSYHLKINLKYHSTYKNRFANLKNHLYLYEKIKIKMKQTK